MKRWLLPRLREGVVPERNVTGQPVASLVAELRESSSPKVGAAIRRDIRVAGPGDVVALDRKQILRQWPMPNSQHIESEFFPLIEFDAADLPWAYSPATSGTSPVRPWIALIVVEVLPGVDLVSGEPGHAPWVLRLPSELVATELPDLREAHLWAHAQVICESASEIEQTLRTAPDQTLSRLLSPRRLLPGRRYIACVVPTFLAGRLAGLGAAVPAAASALNPAWTAGDAPSALPAYVAWRFSTAMAGDFESLVRGIAAAEKLPELHELQVSAAAEGQSVVVPWWPALIPAESMVRSDQPAAAVERIKSAFGADPNKTLGPPLLGAPWVGTSNDARVLLTREGWISDLNLTPMWRAAAGLGAELVRREQESLVQELVESFDRLRESRQVALRSGLSAVVQNRVVDRLQNSVKSGVTAAAAAEVTRVVSIARHDVVPGIPIGMSTFAGRKILRKVWSQSALQPSKDSIQKAGVASKQSVISVDPTPVTKVASLTKPVPLTASVAVKVGRPFIELLNAHFPQAILPRLETIPEESFQILALNTKFVEAMLVGANQELRREFAWRCLIQGFAGTPLRNFWSGDDAASDIEDISHWNGALGSNRPGGQSSVAAPLVIAIRSRLVQRFPNAVPAAVRAKWPANGARQPGVDSSDPPPLEPTFHGLVGNDILYAAFTSLSVADAVGDGTAAKPGWYFLFAENQINARFGLDAVGQVGSPSQNLTWDQLRSGTWRNYLTAQSLPNDWAAKFRGAGGHSASLATLVQQWPFRAFIHASMLARFKGSNDLRHA